MQNNQPKMNDAPDEKCTRVNGSMAVCRRCVKSDGSLFEFRDIRVESRFARKKPMPSENPVFLYTVARVHLASCPPSPGEHPVLRMPEFSTVCMRIRCKLRKSAERIFNIAFDYDKFPRSTIIDVKQLTKILKLDGVECEIVKGECPFLLEHVILEGNEPAGCGDSAAAAFGGDDFKPISAKEVE